MAGVPVFKVAPKASVTLLHGKESDLTERIIFPVTQYNAILSAPRLVQSSADSPGAPFMLMEYDTVKMDDEEIYKLCGGLI